MDKTEMARILLELYTRSSWIRDVAKWDIETVQCRSTETGIPLTKLIYFVTETKRIVAEREAHQALIEEKRHAERQVLVTDRAYLTPLESQRIFIRLPALPSVIESSKKPILICVSDSHQRRLLEDALQSGGKDFCEIESVSSKHYDRLFILDADGLFHDVALDKEGVKELGEETDFRE